MKKITHHEISVMSTAADTNAIRLNSSLHTQNISEDSKCKAIVFYFSVGYFLCPILPTLELPVAAGD